MKKTLFVLSMLAMIVLAPQTACYYDNELEQYGVNNCDTTAVSYTNDIIPIIQAHCLSCHTPGGQQESSPFTSHSNFAQYATEAVERVNGRGSLMPPSGKISNCNIALLEAWVNAGAPNN